MQPPEHNPYASPAFDESHSPILFSTGELASLWERFLGALIDGVIGAPIGLVIGTALGFAFLEAGYRPNSLTFRLATLALGVLISGCIFLALHGYLLATRGQTIGKWIMKTQIVSDDGELLSLASLVFKRYLPIWFISNIPSVGVWLNLANVLAIFRPNRKCLHDELAGTKVVKLASHR